MRAAPRVLLDASVFIAAAGSRTGASALLLSLCRHSHAKAVSSRLILREVERNIQGKLGQAALLRFYQDIAGLDLDLVEALTQEEIASHLRIINPKDAHVLAAALRGEVEVLLTLDRKHFFSPPVLQAGLPFLIMTPGDFLRRLAQ